MPKTSQKQAFEHSAERPCAIYTRQSRARATGFSSCELQRGICTDFACEHRWPLHEQHFDDLGESSKTLDRPALQRLLEEVTAGRIGHVVVYAMDRLTRRLFDLQKLLTIFEEHDVPLHVVTDPNFGDSPGGRLMRNIVAITSEFQQDLTRERLAESRAALKQKGRRVAGRVPYGYAADPESKQLVVDRTAARRIQSMFRQAAAGRAPKEIAAAANKRGWRTSGGNKGSRLWTARQILKVLSNPTYAGFIRNGDGTLPGQHEAIIDPEVFDDVRRVIESRRSRKPGRTPSRVALPLLGLLKCGRCGRFMISAMSQHKNRLYRYYRCRSTADGIPPCRSVGVRTHQIDEFVRSMISALPSDDEVDGGKLARFMKAWTELDSWTQIKSLPKILADAVFDPDGGTIEVSLVGNPASQIEEPRPTP